MVNGGLASLANADGVILRKSVHGGEAHGLRGVFREDQSLERSLVARGEGLVVLKHAVHLDLNLPVFGILDIGDYFQSTVVTVVKLQSRTRDGFLGGLVQEHEFVRVLQRILRGVQRREWSWLGCTAAKKCQREGRGSKGQELRFHKFR